MIDTNRNNFHISATEIRKNPYKNWFFIPKYVREFFVLKVAIIGSEYSGKTNLTHKLANYYNTTYVKEYRKEYIKEEMQNHIENIQHSDYSNIAYEHNRRILESIKNADKLTFIDTEFSSLQTFSINTYMIGVNTSSTGSGSSASLGLRSVIATSASFAKEIKPFK